MSGDFWQLLTLKSRAPKVFMEGYSGGQPWRSWVICWEGEKGLSQ